MTRKLLSNGYYYLQPNYVCRRINHHDNYTKQRIVLKDKSSKFKSMTKTVKWKNLKDGNESTSLNKRTQVV